MQEILVVEDDFFTLTLMAETLRQCGHHVLTAEDGRVALRKLGGRARPIAALITDHHMMHGINGADLITFVRERQAEIPILLTTGDAQAVTGEWSVRLGVTVLLKPFTTGQFMAALRQMGLAGVQP